jgi:hypothetical protein
MLQMMLKVELLKTELLKASPPVHCSVVCVGVRRNEQEETLLTIQLLTHTQLILHMTTYHTTFKVICLF